MAWIYLVIAGLLEIGWAIGLKYTEGFSRLGPSAATILIMAASFAMPLGTAYAIWTGIGTAGTVLLGMALFGEPAAPLRLACITLIVAGVAGLKLLAPH
jgi:quaternary ammonium compound-resistance protein SugE